MRKQHCPCVVFADRNADLLLVVALAAVLARRLFDRIPRITLDTVFLDQDLRVSRLPDRNFLIYVKDY